MVEEYIKSNICHLPWTSLETTPLGYYRPCCLYKEEIKDKNGEKLNVHSHTVDDVMNSVTMTELRKQFLNGEKPAGCESCWKEEESGKVSKRMHMWYKAGGMGQIHIQKNIVNLRFIDLKLGNICNLKCRICSPHSSSQWSNEMAKLQPYAKKKWTEYNKQGAWPRQKNTFLKHIEEVLEYIRFFEITGGEPLMIQEQFDVLQKCIDKGYAKNIEVHYNTNGTHYPEYAVKEIWPHFKRVEIAFSIDDIKERFEYQRHPAKWEAVNENILKFKNSNLKNLSTQICTTISIFNVMYIDELAPFVNKWKPDFWYINILHNPIEFDVQQLPLNCKKEITNKLKKLSIRKEEMNTAINYLSRTPIHIMENWHENLKNKIKTFDKSRKENFEEVFPLLNKVLTVYE